jgi:transcriptional regulator with XRE-family HTH domain
MPLMMEKSNKKVESMSDKALLELIGSFIREHRMRQNKTQQATADAAGVNRSTLVQLESGGGGNLLSFIQVMRAVGQLEFFSHFEIKEQLSPLALAKIQQAKRQRATGKNPGASLQSKPGW